MAEKPEQVIRKFLDEHGGETQATVGHLLTTFGVDEEDHSGRDHITAALREAGVELDRSLTFLGAGDDIHLTTRGVGDTAAEASETAASETPTEQLHAPAEEHPPGWYPDVHNPGHDRWWNGEQWTEHSQRHQIQWAERGRGKAQGQRINWAQEGRSASDDRPQKPWYKEAWAIILGALLALFVVVGVAGALSPSGDGDDGPKEAAETGKTSTAKEQRAQEAQASARLARAARRRAAVRTRKARARRVRAQRARARKARVRRAQVAQARRQEQARQAREQQERDAAKRRQDQQQQEEANCHPSYDPCLKPDAGDYDCEGGSGDGPNYTGPVTVTGADEFDLDSDSTGSGCES